MHKSIQIFYGNNTDKFVELYYDTEMEEDIHVIHCSVVENKTIPGWLHSRKFDLRSQYADGGYSLLFDDNVNINNMDSVLFIEKAYADIMKNEKLKMLIY